MKHLPHTITALIEISVNRYLALDPDAASHLTVLSGKLLKIIINELELPIFFRITEKRVIVQSVCEDQPDTVMRAPLLALVKLSLSRDSGESIMGSDIEMSGDLDVGRKFRDILKNVDIDWEELLSKYTGDIIAHQIGNSVRSISEWGSNTLRILSRDVTEYLQEESRDLPSATEVNQFLTSVDELRLATERAEARIRLLLNASDQQKPDAGGA